MNTFDSLLSKLKETYPDLKFIKGSSFSWSPKDKNITYTNTFEQTEVPIWSLLHEVSHGLLGHTDYTSDFELVKLEAEAWQHAQKLGNEYSIKIDTDHIEDCLDTYRDWLHHRSTCPSCGNISTQQDSKSYRCFNCKSSWTVSNSRFCRPYRLLSSKTA